MSPDEDMEWWRNNRENVLRPGMSAQKAQWVLDRAAFMVSEALHHNVEQNNVDWVIRLIDEYHFPVNMRNRESETPLHRALIRCAGWPVLDALLSRGADLYKPDSKGVTPWQIADEKTQAQITQKYPHAVKGDQ